MEGGEDATSPAVREPGEEKVGQPELLLYDLEAAEMVSVAAHRFQDQRLFTFDARQFIYSDSDEPERTLWLSDESGELHFWRRSRDQHKVDLGVADAVTGEVRSVVEERLNTYIETKRLERLVSGDFLWWSERDGWGHLYRIGPDGTVKNRLTEGAFSVREIVGIDEANGVVFFVANGREAGEDPYYRHLYRVSVDGSGLRLLNPGDFDHDISMAGLDHGPVPTSDDTGDARVLAGSSECVMLRLAFHVQSAPGTLPQLDAEPRQGGMRHQEIVVQR